MQKTSTDYDLRLLRAFVELATDMSYTRAAVRLGITQPNVTVRIQKLEKALGFLLLKRSTRQVELTLEGVRFLAYAKRMVDTADSVRQAASSIKAGYSSTLQVGTVIYRPADHWKVLNPFLQNHNDIDLKVSNSPPHELLQKLHNGVVDVAFFYGPVPPEFDKIVISKTPIGLIISNQSDLADTPKISPAQLKSIHLFLFPMDKYSGYYGRMEEFLRTNQTTFSPIPEANVEATAELVRHKNNGIIAIPWWSTDENIQANGEFVFKLIEGITDELEFSLVRSAKKLTPAADRLWQFANEQFG